MSATESLCKNTCDNNMIRVFFSSTLLFSGEWACLVAYPADAPGLTLLGDYGGVEFARERGLSVVLPAVYWQAFPSFSTD